MLGLSGNPRAVNDFLQPQLKEGVRAISIAGMIPDDQALIWRGPMRSKLINQFLGDVEWGYLDYLIADLPPGTGDEILTIAQQMKPDLAVIVTTPQEVALLDAKRAVSMAKEINIPHIGVIENMSGMICPECGHSIDLFGTGGGRRLAEELHTPFLGEIPIDVEARRLSDQGRPYVLEKWQSEISVEFIKIAGIIENMLNSIN
jgi:ATP-binding protein involved in chromosome partitioning